MKKTGSILTALLICASLIFSSCGALTSTSKESGPFTFTIDQQLADSIARKADGSVTILVSIKEASGSGYSDSKSNTASTANGTAQEVKTALTGMSFTFDNVPYNTELCLNVDIKVGGTTRFSSLTQKFTLTKGGSSSIEAAIYAAMDTPYVLINKTSGYSYRLQELPSDPTSSLTVTDDDILYESDDRDWESYCLDAEGSFWRLSSNNVNGRNVYKMNSTDMTGTTHSYTINFEESMHDETGMYGLCYDPVRDMLTTVIIEPTSEGNYQPYLYSVSARQIPDSVTLSRADITSLEKNPYWDDMNIDGAPFYISAYNGRLYSLLNWDQYPRIIGDNPADPCITVRVLSLDDGSLIRDGTATIPQVNADADKNYYDFNAIYADAGGIYILFHQAEVWSTGPSISYSDYDIPEVHDNGFIDRGGIIVLSPDTLSQTQIIGLSSVKTSMDNMPLRIDDGDAYTLAYSDYALTQPKTTSLSLTWSLAELGTNLFSNPQQIVAIKPKKLIIADGGAFLFSYTGEFIGTDGNFYAGDTSLAKQAKTAERLIEVDLETFSMHVVTEIGTPHLFSYTMPFGFEMTHTVQTPLGSYAYGLATEQTSYNGGTYYRFTTTSQFSNDYPLETTIQFNPEH